MATQGFDENFGFKILKPERVVEGMLDAVELETPAIRWVVVSFDLASC
jgi:hypothetical protein